MPNMLKKVDTAQAKTLVTSFGEKTFCKAVQQQVLPSASLHCSEEARCSLQR